MWNWCWSNILTIYNTHASPPVCVWVCTPVAVQTQPFNFLKTINISLFDRSLFLFALSIELCPIGISGPHFLLLFESMHQTNKQPNERRKEKRREERDSETESELHEKLVDCLQLNSNSTAHTHKFIFEFSVLSQYSINIVYSAYVWSLGSCRWLPYNKQTNK